MRTIRGLREFVNQLDECGEIQRVAEPVDPRYEIPALLNDLGDGQAPAVLFESVKGHTMPVVGNLLGTKRRLALALGIEGGDIIQSLLPKIGKQISPCSQKEDGERVVVPLKNGLTIQELLPVLTHYIGDSGPFITTGITSARDPDSGVTGRGLHRVEIRGNTIAGISLVNPPLSDIYAAHKTRGTHMELAVAVGVDPVILIGTALKAPKGIDKLAAVGGLTGTAVATTPAQSIDVEIPAYAEIVLEGHIDPHEGEKGGILGEVSGCYVDFPSPTVHIATVSIRRNGIYHSLLPQGCEVDELMALLFGLHIVPPMRREFASLREIHFVPGTFGSHLVIAMANDDCGEIRRAATMALSFGTVKKVVMVNTDVDVTNPLEVEWALATRFQADRDLILLPGLKGSPIDPSSQAGFLTAKVGMDATRPSRERFEKIRFPNEIQDRVQQIVNQL